LRGLKEKIAQMRNIKFKEIGRHVSLLALALAGLTLTAKCGAAPSSSAHRPDIVIADFEGTNFGDWQVTGSAFGEAPARGTLPRQMPVDGYLGGGFVSSYHGGDDSTGTLTSPSFPVERKYIQFIGVWFEWLKFGVEGA
jgi:fructan beta-fructosidase